MPDIDYGAILEALNNKADVDMLNISSTGKSTTAKQAMPSGTVIDLTMGASGTTYTAPANGWFTLIVTMTGNYSNITLLVNGVAKFRAYGAGVIPIGDTIAVKKGDIITYYYSVQSGTPSKDTCCFISASGDDN